MAEVVQIRGSGYAGKIRSRARILALTLLTCGVYLPVWYYLVNKELAEIGKAYRTDKCGDSPETSFLAITLGCLSWYHLSFPGTGSACGSLPRRG